MDNSLENYSNDIEAVFNNKPFIVFKNIKGIYVGGNLNQAKSFGFSHPAQFTGKSIVEILGHTETALVIAKTDQEIMSAGVTRISEEIITTPYGVVIYLTKKQSLQNSYGKVIGMMGVVIDITNSKMRQQQAQAVSDKYLHGTSRDTKLEAHEAGCGQSGHHLVVDITTPATGLSVMLSQLDNMSEQNQIRLDSAFSGLEHVAHRLLKPVRAKAEKFPAAATCPNVPDSLLPHHQPHTGTIDIIWLDDSQVFIDSVLFRLSHRSIKHYLDPRTFMAECHLFDKDTPICIDNDFGVMIPIKGIAIARQLHDLGFLQLYIVSGAFFEPDELPTYVTLINKMNLGPLDLL